MSTLSVPLPAHIEEHVQRMVKRGVAPNKAALARMAIEQFIEDQAVMDVLLAEQEVREGKVLRGDLRTLLKNFR